MHPLMVAAPASGSGKSSVTLGLLGALRRRGLDLAPFKVGPDFIDPGHHAAVCGRVSRNLDGWMCGRDAVLASFAGGGRNADLAVIEGAMGLFDGADGATDAGSSAEIARWLGGRILLVVDARAQARSAVAVVHGFTTFAPDLTFAGVLYNRVGSDNHARLLREAHASVPGLPPLLGCLPRNEALTLPERHLGLVTAEDAAATATYAQLADWVAAHVELDRLLAALSPHPQPLSRGARGETPLLGERVAAGRVRGNSDAVRIGIARDEAFCFCYPDNLELLERAGAELAFFSPLAEPLPNDLAGLYLPGGYPELHVERLAANVSLLGDLRTFAQAGAPIYAECGGLLYLTEGLIAPSDNLVGLFPVRARMLSKRQALGYREVTMTAATPLGPAGTVARGHAFHYSELAMPAEIVRSYRLAGGAGQPCGTEGYLRVNVLGSYVHLHFAGNPRLAGNFVANCRAWRDQAR
ncbi:MAG: cobyrinate a,c-diamide synthase [Desulfuromonadales bacterium]|nr:cobyrinate a,c-diamide synthase [Desulfuromonadales bacterium]